MVPVLIQDLSARNGVETGDHSKTCDTSLADYECVMPVLSRTTWTQERWRCTSRRSRHFMNKVDECNNAFSAVPTGLSDPRHDGSRDQHCFSVLDDLPCLSEIDLCSDSQSEKQVERLL